MLESLRRYFRRRRFRTGAKLTRFIAKDIRRDVEVVDASEIDDGYIIARVRTWNVLYAWKGLVPMPELSEPRRLEIETLWEYPLPDGDETAAP